MKSAYLYQQYDELRVYNRINSKPIAFLRNEKITLKRLGFVWDRCNHSYYLKNPTLETIKEVSKLCCIENR